MSGYELALLWFAWVLAGASPGPATLGIAGTSMTQGRRAGVIFALGILCGGAFWGIAAALGMSAVMVANVWVFEILRYAGAAYLLYLAVKSLRSALRRRAPLAPLSKGAVAAGRIFAKGALIHLTNPKAIISWGAVYAIALPAGSAPADLLWLFGFLYSGGIVVFLGYAVAFSSARVVAAYTRLRRWFEGGFALLFGAAGIKILTARIVP
ncbi:LysE family transporter [Sulfitobacter albidus]|uniref:LysE family transporter n=1 Tax=Sulfitobacter albidus TaxID=2829501 RepID=A0A975PLV4_9RHOB|nr:LysE family transporter [Sulfitobacter albidus]QUJ75756.1 LysE family transporter [Sulfitobacter albidus]